MSFCTGELQGTSSKSTGDVDVSMPCLHETSNPGKIGHSTDTYHHQASRFLLGFLSSIDRLKGKITGTSHMSWENLWFPVDFPFNQSNESSTDCSGYKIVAQRHFCQAPNVFFCHQDTAAGCWSSLYGHLNRLTHTEYSIISILYYE